ncbi:MBL fold metallo-hydrolase [Pseudomaricurvus alkylphenolicus]|jgi:glyoxylase-like metal-dependent hydrolase (beta-lactamase superfamily II)|uniref:MBL fold metallo-hydrolase n=1 Tax=Pseudomaricurvus alkylphenolicus TaxID=1306991 RepID=UPI00141F41EB|nr:MBL fold metallo-hydrolase [Pseudomaricurvus alkylphenolicus]NIB42535.1 MBL fold metallo-hydrolase [Pseudomaricurvus alkylphenolicus]
MTMLKKKLSIEVVYGTLPPWPNSTILYTDDSAVLVDTLFMKSDAALLAKRIKEIGKPLEAIFLTHSHPDHVWGGVELLRHFPDAKIYARPLIRKEIELDFRARQLRWTGVFNVGPFEGEIPTDLFDIQPLEGDSYDFGGHEIQLVDLKPAETVYATAFYVPEIKTYIAGDQLYNQCHYYIGAGLNRPDLWIESIEDVRARFDIDVVVPGHGYVGGTEIFDEAIDYLSFYQSQYEPYRPQIEMVQALENQYPDWKLEGVIYMTIGPAMTDPALIDLTHGHIKFGEGTIAIGSYSA